MAKKTKGVQYYEGVGRRKKAVARVRLYLAAKQAEVTVNNHKIKAGEIYINNHPAVNFFSLAWEQQTYLLPLKLTNNEGRFAVSILVHGGGRAGQLEAVSHGISRALNLVDKDTFRPVLKEHGLLTRDPRKKERRKVGTGGKARRAKQSPKR